MKVSICPVAHVYQHVSKGLSVLLEGTQSQKPVFSQNELFIQYHTELYMDPINQASWPDLMLAVNLLNLPSGPNIVMYRFKITKTVRMLKTVHKLTGDITGATLIFYIQAGGDSLHTNNNNITDKKA